MSTNAQMEARDAFEAARNRIKLIREGILDPVEGRSVGMGLRRFSSLAIHSASEAAGSTFDFHIPAVRPYRLKTRHWKPSDTYQRDQAQQGIDRAHKQLLGYYQKICQEHPIVSV